MNGLNMDTKTYLPLPLFDTLEHLNTQASVPQHTSLPLDANKDFQHALNFLHSYRGSNMTFNSYRREIERLLQWSWFIHKKSIKELTRIDFETFLEFCQAPPKHWIGTKHVERFLDQNGIRIHNPEWRPYVVRVSKTAFNNGGLLPDINNYVLSKNTLQAIFSILSSFYNYLEQEEYLSINPVAQIRQKSKFLRKRHLKAPVRRLSELQWAYVMETVTLMANENPALHERTLFIMTALFAMYLRISELAASKRWEPQMGHFFRDRDENWWFKTVGKGNKERDISVSDAMLNALVRYRLSLGLSKYPPPGDAHPLIPKFVGKGPITDVRQIRNIVQNCFDRTIERLKKDGFNDDADMLSTATVHWLRHTGISEDVKHRPREHVRDDAGHSSSAITDRYIDIELRERHASAKKKLITVD